MKEFWMGTMLYFGAIFLLACQERTFVIDSASRKGGDIHKE
jgi:hypothetical protein